MPSGSVTRANTKISAVDGTAFVDFSTANVLTNYAPKSKLTVTDSTGKKLTGYIKAAGTGETWEDTYLSDFSVGEDSFTGIRGSVAGNIDSIGVKDDNLRFTVDTSSGSHIAHRTKAQIALSRTRFTVDYYIPSSNSVVTRLFLSANVHGVTEYFSGALDTWLSVTRSYTVPIGVTDLQPHPASSASWSLQDVGGDDVIYFNKFQVERQLTPSTTGVTVTSTADGTTYNWASKEEGFNYNDASGYTYEILDITSRRGMSFRVGTRL